MKHDGRVRMYLHPDHHEIVYQITCTYACKNASRHAAFSFRYVHMHYRHLRRAGHDALIVFRARHTMSKSWNIDT